VADDFIKIFSGCFDAEWSGKLRILYWFLRYHRKWNEAPRRAIYHQIAAEKNA
jgi:hypothetical protein